MDLSSRIPKEQNKKPPAAWVINKSYTTKYLSGRIELLKILFKKGSDIFWHRELIAIPYKIAYKYYIVFVPNYRRIYLKLLEEDKLKDQLTSREYENPVKNCK